MAGTQRRERVHEWAVGCRLAVVYEGEGGVKGGYSAKSG